MACDRGFMRKVHVNKTAEFAEMRLEREAKKKEDDLREEERIKEEGGGVSFFHQVSK